MPLDACDVISTETRSVETSPSLHPRSRHQRHRATLSTATEPLETSSPTTGVLPLQNTSFLRLPNRSASLSASGVLTLPERGASVSVYAKHLRDSTSASPPASPRTPRKKKKKKPLIYTPPPPPPPPNPHTLKVQSFIDNTLAEAKQSDILKARYKMVSAAQKVADQMGQRKRATCSAEVTVKTRMIAGKETTDVDVEEILRSLDTTKDTSGETKVEHIRRQARDLHEMEYHAARQSNVNVRHTELEESRKEHQATLRDSAGDEFRNALDRLSHESGLSMSFKTLKYNLYKNHDDSTHALTPFAREYNLSPLHKRKGKHEYTSSLSPERSAIPGCLQRKRGAEDSNNNNNSTEHTPIPQQTPYNRDEQHTPRHVGVPGASFTSKFSVVEVTPSPHSGSPVKYGSKRWNDMVHGGTPLPGADSYAVAQRKVQQAYLLPDAGNAALFYSKRR